MGHSPGFQVSSGPRVLFSNWAFLAATEFLCSRFRLTILLFDDDPSLSSSLVDHGDPSDPTGHYREF
jgi:hypothetical protein